MGSSTSATTVAPVVALVSPNGWLGRNLLPVYVDYVKKGEFSGLHLITTRSNADLEAAGADLPSGQFKIFETKYDNDSLTKSGALKGVHVMICAASPSTGADALAPGLQALIEVAAAEGVKVYLNSEFGSDYDINTYGNVLYEAKKAHRIAAEKLGLKSVALATSAFSPALRTHFFGVHGNKWNISGSGDTPYAVTDLPDIAQYTARAAILAINQPESVPRRLRVYSDIKTWNEYADITERITGQPVERIYHTQAELEERYASGEESPYYVLQLVAATKLHDFSDCNHNELLNPGQRYFKPISFEESLKTELASAKST